MFIIGLLTQRGPECLLSQCHLAGKSASISQWLPYTVHTVHTDTTCPAQSINQYTPPPRPFSHCGRPRTQKLRSLSAGKPVINDSLSTAWRRWQYGCTCRVSEYTAKQVIYFTSAITGIPLYFFLHMPSLRVHCQTGYLFHFCHHWHSIVLLSAHAESQSTLPNRLSISLLPSLAFHCTSFCTCRVSEYTAKQVISFHFCHHWHSIVLLSAHTESQSTLPNRLSISLLPSLAFHCTSFCTCRVSEYTAKQVIYFTSAITGIPLYFFLHMLSLKVHCQTGYLFHFCHHWHSIVLLSVLFPIPSGVCCTDRVNRTLTCYDN